MKLRKDTWTKMPTASNIDSEKDKRQPMPKVSNVFCENVCGIPMMPTALNVYSPMDWRNMFNPAGVGVGGCFWFSINLVSLRDRENPLMARLNKNPNCRLGFLPDKPSFSNLLNETKA